MSKCTWDEEVSMRAEPRRQPLCDASSGHWSLPSLAQAAEPSNTASTISTARQLLMPILLTAFLESAPIAFAPATPTSSYDAHFQTVAAVAQIAQELFRGPKASQAEIRSLRGLVLKVESYFPFGTDALHARDVQVRDNRLQL